MKISFTLKEHNLFDATKFLNEKVGEIKKTKIILSLVFLVIFSYTIFSNYLETKNIWLSVFLAIFGIIFIFLYLKFFDYSFEKKIRKFLEKNFKNDFGKKIFIEIEEKFFKTYDEEKTEEMRFSLEKLEIFDEKKYFFLVYKNGLGFFIPKDEISEEELKEIKNILKK